MKNVRCLLDCEQKTGHAYCQYDLVEVMSSSEEEEEITEGRKRDPVYNSYRDR